MRMMRARIMILGALASVRAVDVNPDTGSTKEKAKVEHGRFTVTSSADSGALEDTFEDTLDLPFVPTLDAGTPDDTTLGPGSAPAADPSASPAAAPALDTAAPTATATATAAPTAAPTLAGVAGAAAGAVAAFAGTMAPTYAAPGLAIAAVAAGATLTSAHTAPPSFGGGTSNGLSFTDPSFGGGTSIGEEEWDLVEDLPGTPASECTDVPRPGTPSSEGSDADGLGPSDPFANEGEQQPDE